MKKFLRNIGLFIIPVIMLVIIIFFVPVNRKYAYAYLNKSGCEGRSSWLYRNIFVDTIPIDIAFIGTSHSMNAVNDQQLEELLSDSLKYRIYPRNLAICNRGRDFDFVLVRDLLQHKKVRLLVLEIQQDEPKDGHPDFIHLVRSMDMLTAPRLDNKIFITQIHQAFLLRLQYLRETATGEDIRHNVDVPITKYGYNGDAVVANPEVLHNGRSRDNSVIPLGSPLNDYSMKYLDKIAKLARENNMPLVFLYLPRYGYSKPDEERVRMYSKYGRVLFLPPDTLDDPTGWRDEEHVNSKATNQYSHYLVGELIKELYHGGTESN